MEEINREDAEFFDVLESAPSIIDKEEEMTYDDIEKGIKLIELEYKREELESRKQDRKQRGQFSIWIFGFMGIYMMLALVILGLSGSDVFDISDTVLVSLLTTTTADVIGIFIIVAKYLFHKQDN